jgi:hypothetical protein
VTSLALLLGSACHGTSKGSGSGGTGGTVGVNPPGPIACGTSSVTLTKQVPLSVGSALPDLQVGPAWIAHSSESYVSYLYGAIKVTNVGEVGHCFVQASSVSYRDAAGRALGTESLTYVYGRVKVLSVVSTWTCLDPGESAYFNLIEPLSYFDVASIDVARLDYDDGGKDPLADLEATSYTGTGSSVSVVVSNVGTGSADNASLVVYATSASGEFLFWTFAQFADQSIWGPGEQRTATAYLSYQAPCPNLLVVPYYDAVEVSPSISPGFEHSPTAEGMAADDARAASLLQRRHRIEQAKHALLRR